jgi:acetyl esterase/lipase
LVFDGRNDLTDVRPLWLNTRTGRTRGLDVQAPGGAWQWLFDSTGEPRLVVTRREQRLAVHWRGPGQMAQQNDWQLIAEGDVLNMPFTPRFVDDAGHLYVTHQRGPEGFEVLSRFDFQRRAPAREPWVVTPGFDFHGKVLGGRRGAAAAGVRVDAELETTVWLNPKMKALQEKADTMLPGRVNRLSCRRCDEADAVVLVLSGSDIDPGQLLLYRAAEDKWQRVSRMLEGIDPAQMASVEFQRIRARDGRDLPLWLTLPLAEVGASDALAAARKKARPAVVLVHGGPWVRGGHWQWEPMAQFLASRGYLVISPEFRGSTGYGQAHFRAGFKEWGRAMQDDVADAVLWAQAQGLTDERVCVAGGSYGGYATLMGLVRHPELYRCGVAWVAVTDLFLFLEGSIWVADDISGTSRRHTLPELVGDVKADAEMLTAVSPVAQAARIRAPLLLAFGETDERVPLAHGKRVRAALQKAGHEPEWVTYANEGHEWRLPQTRIDFAKRVEKFLAQHLPIKP